MNGLEIDERFKLALSILLRMLPDQQHVNATILIKGGFVSDADELLLRLADKSDLSVSNFQNAVVENFVQSSLSQEALMEELGKIIRNHQSHAQSIASVEYDRWWQNPNHYTPFSLTQND